MAWSTRQVADLAGTTVKAVRYYHQLGLLPEPERTANGYYRRYEVSHLIRLLQIKRLSDLGVALSDLESVGSVGDDPDVAFATLDEQLAATIARLTEARAELATIRRHRGSTYLPPAFAGMSGDLTDRQRALLMVYSTVLSEESLRRLHQVLAEPNEIDEEFEALPAEADDVMIEDLVRRMVPGLLRSRHENPWSKAPVADAPGGARHAEQAMAEAVTQLYNPAQLRVLRQVNERLTAVEAEAASDSATEPPVE